MKISDVNRGVQKNKKRMRVGRGPGSGKGRTAGRGNKGQGQLAGWSAPAIFEGGRMPINNRHGLLVAAVNVDDLDASFASGAEVSPATIKQAGLAKGIWHELKILGDGKLTKALKVSAHHFSAQARQKIEAAGGTATELPGAAPVEKGKKKAARKKPTV